MSFDRIWGSQDCRGVGRLETPQDESNCLGLGYSFSVVGLWCVLNRWTWWFFENAVTLWRGKTVQRLKTDLLVWRMVWCRCTWCHWRSIRWLEPEEGQTCRWNQSLVCVFALKQDGELFFSVVCLQLWRWRWKRYATPSEPTGSTGGCRMRDTVWLRWWNTCAQETASRPVHWPFVSCPFEIKTSSCLSVAE